MEFQILFNNENSTAHAAFKVSILIVGSAENK